MADSTRMAIDMRLAAALRRRDFDAARAARRDLERYDYSPSSYRRDWRERDPEGWTPVPRD